MTPVVLHHGLFGHGDLTVGPWTVRYFRGIDRAITAAGHPMIVPSVHPTGSVRTRAEQLKRVVLAGLAGRGLSGRRVVLMAHSMGGLDARYAVAKLGLDEHVSAVVTVTTPHRGSPFADWAMRHLGRIGVMRAAGMLGLDVGAGADLTTDGCAAFNDAVPDVPGIVYASVSARRPWWKMPPFALHAHRVVSAAEGDNDGLVSVRSSQWGDHRGTWEADHWHTINRRYRPEMNGPARDVAPLWLGLLRSVCDRVPSS